MIYKVKLSFATKRTVAYELEAENETKALRKALASKHNKFAIEHNNSLEAVEIVYKRTAWKKYENFGSYFCLLNNVLTQAAMNSDSSIDAYSICSVDFARCDDAEEMRKVQAELLAENS